jgi:hypothetical protein
MQKLLNGSIDSIDRLQDDLFGAETALSVSESSAAVLRANLASTEQELQSSKATNAFQSQQLGVIKEALGTLQSQLDTVKKAKREEHRVQALRCTQLEGQLLAVGKSQRETEVEAEQAQESHQKTQKELEKKVKRIWDSKLDMERKESAARHCQEVAEISLSAVRAELEQERDAAEGTRAES